MNSTKRKTRSWKWRFGLRTVLLLITCIALVLGLVVVPRKAQRDAVIELRRLGADVSLESSPLDPAPAWFAGEEFKPPGPLTSMLHKNLPEEYLLDVNDVFIKNSITDLDRTFLALSQLHSCDSLLINPVVNEKLIDLIVDNRCIRQISFASSHVSEEVLKQIGRMRHLKALYFFGCTVELKGLAHLDKLTALETMFIRCQRCDDEALSFLSGLKNLTWLEIETEGLDGSGLRYLHGLEKMERLWLAGMPLEDAEVEFLSTMPNLWSIDLSETNVSDGALKYLAVAKSLRQIELSGTRVTGSGFRHWRHHPQVRSITLRRTPVSEGLEHLATCSVLEYVSFSQSDLTDEVAAKLSSSKSLETIRIRDTQVTIEGLRKLCQIPTLTGIGQNVLDETQARTIEEEFPDMVWYGPDFDY